MSRRVQPNTNSSRQAVQRYLHIHGRWITRDGNLTTSPICVALHLCKKRDADARDVTPAEDGNESCLVGIRILRLAARVATAILTV